MAVQINHLERESIAHIFRIPDHGEGGVYFGEWIVVDEVATLAKGDDFREQNGDIEDGIIGECLKDVLGLVPWRVLAEEENHFGFELPMGRVFV